MTNSNSSSRASSFKREGLQLSNGLLEIYKAIALIVDINEEHKHHIIHNIFEHLFHGKKVTKPIEHPDVIDFLSGMKMIMEDFPTLFLLPLAKCSIATQRNYS